MAKSVLVIVGLIWAVFLLDLVVPVELNAYGLVPRTLRGLFGVLTMPFLHANFGHLLANTIPLLVLLLLLIASKPRPWEIVLEIAVAGGLLLWVFGRSADHIGASGLVSGLIAFLILSGLLERRPVPLLVSLVVGFLYGGTLLVGVIPFIHADVSWDGHLTGAIAGAAGAFFLGKQPRPEEKRSLTENGEP
jgi:membrane associated rhomboid family serine protease